MAEIALAARQSRMNAAADLSKTLVGLLVNSRQAVRLVETDDFDSLSGDYLDNAQGRAVDRVAAGYSAAAVHGVNTVGVIPTLNAVESRAFGVDTNVAATLVGLLTNSRQAIHDGTSWMKMSGGVDNAAAMASPVGAFIAGIARSALPVYTDGDVAIPVLDLAGRLMVNTGGIAVEDDDDSVAAGAAHETVIPLSYGFDGTNWRRQNVSALGTGLLDERKMGLHTAAFVRGINSMTAAGSQGEAVQARPISGFAGASETLTGLLTNSVMFYHDMAGALARADGDVGSAISGRVLANINALYAAGINVGVDNTGAAVLRPVEARGTLNAATDESLVGLFTRSALLLADNTLVPGARMVSATSRLPLNATGAATNAYEALNTNATVLGFDNTGGGAGVLRAVEARIGDALATFAPKANYGLISNCRLGGYDQNYSDWVRLGCDRPDRISGRAVAIADSALYSAAINVGVDNTGAAVLRPVEARGAASTPQANTLIRLATQAQMCGIEISATTVAPCASDKPADVSGRGSLSSWYANYANAINVGVDNTGAAVLRPVEARLGDTYGNALYGLMVNARLGAYDLNVSDIGRLSADLASNISGRVATTPRGLYANAINVGVDTTGAAALRPVEARAFSGYSGLATSAYALLTASALVSTNLAGGVLRPIYNDVPSTASGVSAASTYALYANAVSFGRDTTAGLPGSLLAVEARPLSSFAGAATTLVALNTVANVSGIDNTSGSVMRQVEARNADDGADFAAALIGLLVNNRPSYWQVGGSPDWTRVFGNLFSAANGLAITAATHGPYSISMGYGYDSSGPTMRAIEARNGGVFDNAYYGLLVNSRPAFYNLATNEWVSNRGDIFSNVSGRTFVANPGGIYVNAFCVGVDNTGAAVLRPVEARDFAQVLPGNDVASALIGLTTNSRMAAFDISAGSWGGIGEVLASSPGTSAQESAPAMLVAQARESGFAAARRGKRFYVTHQTPGTLITCQTSFVATTPSFMLRINSAAIRAIIRNLNVGIANTPGGITYITAMIDTADRWSSGGNAWTPQNTNEESATAAVALFYDTPTASAAGAGTRYLATAIAPAVAGTTVSMDFSDGVLLGATAATFMVYVWAATTAPQVVFNMEYEEVA